MNSDFLELSFQNAHKNADFKTKKLISRGICEYTCTHIPVCFGYNNSIEQLHLYYMVDSSCFCTQLRYCEAIFNHDLVIL